VNRNAALAFWSGIFARGQRQGGGELKIGNNFSGGLIKYWRFVLIDVPIRGPCGQNTKRIRGCLTVFYTFRSLCDAVENLQAAVDE
jgi:hypothetical protein